MAYAELAGLPARHGLFAAALGPLAAAFFALSPYLQTGPVALTVLLTLGALVPVAVPGSAEYVGFAALLALVVVVVRVLVGALRGGWISYLMSRPMLDGFASGAAILIVVSQLPDVLGVDRRRGSQPSALGHPSSLGLGTSLLCPRDAHAADRDRGPAAESARSWGADRDGCGPIILSCDGLWRCPARRYRRRASEFRARTSVGGPPLARPPRYRDRARGIRRGGFDLEDLCDQGEDAVESRPGIHRPGCRQYRCGPVRGFSGRRILLSEQPELLVWCAHPDSL